MRFEKYTVAHLSNCYAVLLLWAQGREYALYAADDGGACIAVDTESRVVTRIWDAPGGTMSMIPVPGTDGEFLASRRFLPGFHARHAEIVRVRRDGVRWDVSPWMELPYVHRFDLVQSGGRTWFLGCILTAADSEAADFGIPGHLVAAALDDACSPPKELSVIAEGMHRNHGYFHQTVQGEDWILTACDEGVFRLYPPAEGETDWRVEQLTTEPASDVAACDLNGDGRPELVVISPFHGDELWIYENPQGLYRRAAQIPHRSAFLHAIWAGTLQGENGALIGGRAQQRETFWITWKDGAYRTQLLEKGFGASNAAAWGNRILLANRETGECVLWRALPDDAR